MAHPIVITSGATHFHYDVSRFVDFQIFNLMAGFFDNDFDSFKADLIYTYYVGDSLVILLNYVSFINFIKC
jgi:hypothetical protein